MRSGRALMLGVALSGPTLGAAACGGDDGGGGSAFERLLERIPASALSGDDPGPQLYYVDMSIRWEQLGLADASAEERLEEVGALSRPDTFTVPPQLFEQRFFVQLDEPRDEVAFSGPEIEREAYVAALPAQTFVVDVPVGPEEIEQALRADQTWSGDLEELDADGEPYFSWGEGLEPDLERLTPLHSLGRGGQLAVEESDEGAVVVRTLQDDDMQAALAAGSGEEPSVLDEGPLVPLLEGVGEGDVIQAFATFEPLSVDVVLRGGTDPERIEQVLEELDPLDPYDSIMAVEIVDGEETRTEMLLAHEDEEAAEANAGRLEEVLAEGVSIVSRQPVSELFPDAQVEQRGDVVAVTVGGEGHFRAAVQAIQQRDVFITN